MCVYLRCWLILKPIVITTDNVADKFKKRVLQ